jgi:hypothetical protein
MERNSQYYSLTKVSVPKKAHIPYPKPTADTLPTSKGGAYNVGSVYLYPVLKTNSYKKIRRNIRSSQTSPKKP